MAHFEVVPASLREACQVAAAAPALREIFRPAFIDNLIRCEKRVSDVERRRYLEMVYRAVQGALDRGKATSRRRHLLHALA